MATSFHILSSLFFIVVLSWLLLGQPEGKRQLGRPRHRWVNNIRMYLEEIGWGDMDWIGLAQDRDKWEALVTAVMNLWVP
jgi:hypothetical protein